MLANYRQIYAIYFSIGSFKSFWDYFAYLPVTIKTNIEDLGEI